MCATSTTSSRTKILLSSGMHQKIVTITDYKLQAKGKEKFRKNAEKMA
jgi:hypothetical protein